MEFQVLDAAGQPVPGSEFETASTGRGICAVGLEIGQNYKLDEVELPPLLPMKRLPVAFTTDSPNKQLAVANQVLLGSKHGAQ